MCTTLCLNATNVYPSSIAAFLDGVKRPQLFERLILTKMDSLDLEIFECLCNIMICRGIRLKTLVAAYCEQLTMYPEDDPSIVIAAMHPDAEIFDIGRDPVFPGRESMFVEAILQRLPNLTDVGLSGRQLLLDEFPLTQVKRLDISNTTTNWFPMALPHLQHIDFSMQTGDSSLTLNAALGNMAIERVTAMFVSLESPIIAGRCNYLQILNLNYSNLSRTFRRSFAEYMSQGGMPSLQHLCVMSDQEYHHRWTRRLVRVMSSHARRCVIDAKGKAWTDEGAFQQLLNIHRDHYSPGALHAIRINVAASLYSLFEAHTHKGSWRITVTQ
jgi:hypothetical protein